MAIEQMAKLLDGIEGTGAGTGIVLQKALKHHSMHVTFTNSGGSVTALVMALEGSLNGSNWVTLGELTFAAGDITNKGAMLTVQTIPVKHVRANTTTLTETGTTAVTAQYLGVD